MIPQILIFFVGSSNIFIRLHYPINFECLFLIFHFDMSTRMRIFKVWCYVMYKHFASCLENNESEKSIQLPYT